MLPDYEQDEQTSSFTRQDFIGILSGLGAGVGAASLTIRSTLAAKPGQLDTPTLIVTNSNRSSIELQVSAGSSGAPGGFVIQWMLKTEYIANNQHWPVGGEKRSESATFSAEPTGSPFALGPNAIANVKIGDLDFVPGVSATYVYALKPQGELVFRTFALAANRLSQSEPSIPVEASLLLGTTPDCVFNQNCPKNLDFWKANGPGKCSGTSSQNFWPLSSLQLGNKTYDAESLCGLLLKSTDEFGFNAMVQQLIAAKLNIVNSDSSTALASCIAAADALIGNRTLPALGKDAFPTQQTFELVIALTNYNEGLVSP